VIQVLGQKFQPGDWINPAQFGQRLFYKMFGGTHLVNRAGLARTFQNIRLFREMSVVENLLVAQHMRVNRNLLAGILIPGLPAGGKRRPGQGLLLAGGGGSGGLRQSPGGEMSYGQQRRWKLRAPCAPGRR
jgi:branched-chain amino acid transport system ATP-binding protein